MLNSKIERSQKTGINRNKNMKRTGLVQTIYSDLQSVSSYWLLWCCIFNQSGTGLF